MSGNLITPKGRLSFPTLFEPRAMPGGGEPKYGCTIIFDTDADLKPLKAAALAAAKEKWGDKAEDLIRTKKVKWPFLDGGNELRQGFGEGTTFIRPNAKSKPGVVDRYAGPDGKPRPITDPADIYPGCYVRASVRAFAYDTSGNKGISFGLQNLQKLDEGERLDGRMRAEDEFEAIETAPASMNGHATSDELDDILS